ncbi:MAG: hypothetical protein JRG92_15105 [Deltaproteobacteria bacterium]|nr:hypothetical protein [Deltaproteobacteria bacterium]MBW2384958.1 hypothetical protein [Deltaproteobacteria bacterium]
MNWLLGAALVLIALVWFSLTLDRGLSLRDEGYLLHMGARVAKGEVPHRDFVEAYGPGVFTTTAVLLETARFEILGLRLGLAAIKAATVLLSFAILLRITPRRIAFIGALFAIVYWGRASLNLNTPTAALYTIPIGLLAVLLLLRAGTRPTRAAHILVGLAAGVALLYKQSVGAMSAVGLGLAIAALSVLETREEEEDGGGAATPLFVLLSLWAAAAILILLPTAPFMGARDYVIHGLPIHLLMGVVGLAVHRSAPRVRLRWIIVERLLPYAGGVALAVVPVLGLYAAWGALPELLYDMFVFPQSLRNYYLPVFLPRPAFALLGLGVATFVASGLLALSGRRRTARQGALLCGVSLVVAYAVWYRSGTTGLFPDGLWRVSALFDWILPALLVLAATGVLWRDTRNGKWEARTSGLLVLAFHQAFLCFQIFPRAGHNVWMLGGAMVPLATLLAHRGFLAATGRETTRARRRAAALLCAALPLWLAAPVAAKVLAIIVESEPGRIVRLPHAKGLTMDLEDWKLQQVDSLQKLVWHLKATDGPETRVLLIGNELMIYFASDRLHLVPEREFLLYSAASGMIPQSEVHRLGDEEIARRLETATDVTVVISDDPSAMRLLALLPEAGRVITRHYRVDARFGRYAVWRRKEDHGHSIAR